MSFFQAIQVRKICFTKFQNKKTSFQPIKKEVQKAKKIEIFPKGLTHGFGQKMVIFPCLFFLPIQARKMCFTIFQNKKTPFQDITTTRSKSRKIEIFPKGVKPSFWSKNGHFSMSFFLRNISQENLFYNILKRKIALLAHKKNKLKKSKI